MDFTLGRMLGTRAELNFDPEVSLTANIELHELQRVSLDATTQSRCASVVLEGAQGDLGSVQLKAQRVQIDGVEGTQDPSGWTAVRASSVAATQLRVEGAGLTLTVVGADLPQGLRWAAGQGEIPELVVDRAHLELSDVATIKALLPTSYGLLDSVNGQVKLEVGAVLAVYPLIHPDITNYFEIDVRDGIIDYKKLEHQSPSVVDAVIDFAVRGQQLVLEKNFPFIPGDETTLVAWPLDLDELELAQRRLVRLRTLLGYEIRERFSDRVARAASCFVLDSIVVNALDVQLSLTSPSTIELGNGLKLRFGDAQRPGVRRFKTTGSLRQSRNDTPDDSALEFVLEDINFRVDDAVVGTYRVQVDHFHIDRIQGTLMFDGFTPTVLSADAMGLRITGLKLCSNESESAV